MKNRTNRVWRKAMAWLTMVMLLLSTAPSEMFFAIAETEWSAWSVEPASVPNANAPLNSADGEMQWGEVIQPPVVDAATEPSLPYNEPLVVPTSEPETEWTPIEEPIVVPTPEQEIEWTPVAEPEQPRLNIANVPNLDHAMVGETVEYTVTVTNAGNVKLTSIQVTDDKTGASWNVSSLAPGESDVRETISYVTTAADVGELVNTAVATCVSNGQEISASAAASVMVMDLQLGMPAPRSPAAPDITVEMTVTQNNVYAGEDVQFDITVTNTGNVPLTEGVYLDDPEVSSGTGWLVEAGTELAVGASKTRHVVCEIIPAYLATGQLVNGITATATYGEQTVTKTANATVTVRNPLKLTATVSPAAANVGDTVTYSFKVENLGVLPIANITISNDKIGGVGSTVASLPVDGTDTVTSTYTLGAADVGAFVNTATATGSYTKYNKQRQVTSAGSSATVTVTGQAGKPAIMVTKTADRTQVYVGEDVNFTITVKNTGNVTLTEGVKIEDDDLGAVANQMAVEVGTPFAPNEESQTRNVNALITPMHLANGGLNGNVTATATYNGQTVTATDSTPVQVLNPLRLEKTVSPDRASVGDTVTYTFTVKNLSPNDRGVTLTNVTITDAKIGGGIPTVASLAPGETKSVTASYTLQAADVGSFVNTATAGASFEKFGGKYQISSAPASATMTVRTKVNPSLLVEKTSTTSTAKVGDVVTYTVTVKNNGNVPITGITVVDDKSGDRWNIASLTVDASDTHTVTCTMPAIGEFVNTATATATYDGAPIAAFDDYTVTVTGQAGKPAISVTKTASTRTAKVGDVVSYDITVTNSGSVPLTGILVRDGELAMIWTIDDLAVGESNTNTVTCTMTAAGEFTNTATANVMYNGTLLTATDSWTVRVDAPALSLTKSASATTAVAGDTVTFTLTVENSGNVPLSDVVVKDTVLGQTFPKIDTLAAGTSETYTIVHTITAAEAAGASFTNHAEADGWYNGQKLHDEASVTVTMGGAKTPHLTVTKSVSPNPAYEGDVVNFTITVTNDGTVRLTEIKVQDPEIPSANVTLPYLDPNQSYTKTNILYTITAADVAAGSYTNTATADAAYSDQKVPVVDGSATVTVRTANPALKVEKSSTITEARVGDVVGYTVKVTNTGNVTLNNINMTDDKSGSSWTISALAPNTSDTNTITCVMPAVGVFINTATASAMYNGTRVTASDNHRVTVTAADAPALSLTKSVDTLVAVTGDTVTFTLTVKNSGNVPLSDVIVKDTILGQTFPKIDTLAAGASETYTIVHTVTPAEAAGATFTNHAEADGWYKGQKLHDEAFVTVRIGGEKTPHLTVTKTVSPDTAHEGDVVNFTITVINDGTVRLENIKVEDPEITSANVTLPYLNPGESYIKTNILYTITAADAAAGSYTNTATADAAYSDKKVPVEDGSATVTVETAKPALTVDKSSTINDATVGDRVTYTVIVSNTGNVTLNNINVTDDKSGSTWMIASLGVGSSNTHIVTCVMPAAGMFVNTATASTTYKGTPVTASDDHRVNVTAPNAPVLKLTKTASTRSAVAGDVVTFTLTVSNGGNVPLSNVVVQDPILGEVFPAIPSLAVGTSQSYTIVHTITQADAAGGSYTNYAEADGEYNGQKLHDEWNCQ